MSIMLLAITKEKEVKTLLSWGLRVAEAEEATLHVVHPEIYPKSQDAIPQLLDKPCTQPLLESIRQAIEEHKPTNKVHLTLLRGPDPLAEVLTFLKQEKGTLLLTGPSEINRDTSPVLRQKRDGLLDRISCDVMVMHDPTSSMTPPKNILVPVAGGPHAEAALQMALKLAEEDATITALYVEPEAGEDAHDVGALIVERILQKIPEEHHKRIKTKVVLADNILDGLAATIQEDSYDLVLMGASSTGWLQKSLFGNIPVKLLQRNLNVPIGVFHSSQPVTQKARDFFRYWLSRFLPQLKRQERIALFDRLQSGSHVSIDFIALIGLSTIIAAFGLINNAGAVIIGAMLVAPLMTPMIGTGLGLVQGNVTLVREAIRAIVLGFLLSLTLGVCCGFLGALKFGGTPQLTGEMLARCQFNIFDLLVALFSGIAAAYALARPGLLEALPGVAIAAALVPPIATVGIALAWGHLSQALQAASLFGINLLAITLASTLTLYMFGIRARHKQPKLWAKRLTVTLMVVATFVAIPLGTALLAQVTPTDRTLKQAIHKRLTQEKYHSLAKFEHPRQHERESITLTLYSVNPPGTQLVKDLTQLVRSQLNNPKLRVRVVSLRTWQLPSPKPPSTR